MSGRVSTGGEGKKEVPTEYTEDTEESESEKSDRGFRVFRVFRGPFLGTKKPRR
jgi:hypothetical protein